jgi:hypothetical protein
LHGAGVDVAEVPISEVVQFYSVISPATPKSVGGYRETKCLRDPEVDDEPEFGRLLNRQICCIDAFL